MNDTEADVTDTADFNITTDKRQPIPPEVADQNEE